MDKKMSARQELARYEASGDLRAALERVSGGRNPPLSRDAITLLATIVARYCESRRK